MTMSTNRAGCNDADLPNVGDDESIRKRSIRSSLKRRVCIQCGGDIEGGGVPCVCHHYKPVKFESGAWFLRQIQRALTLMPWSISTDKLEQIEEECETNPGPSDVSRGELHSIREFLELLSAKLAGGPLEGTKVGPLYDHPAYTNMFERHHSTLRDALAALSTALQDALTCKTWLDRVEQGSMLAR
ncbi:unnamed protein product [Parnassius apollo]|uniref:(apollo) hypothetical protein n=1 Tax=Parnassius apollo TaxID=110799 RepID=A0A8S3WC91_PARAO|nr:unnamed protein product [Parnassius apollo]